jgi:ribonuclease PH
VSTANGSALVRLGETTMVCGIKAEIAEPSSNTPNDGYVGTCWFAAKGLLLQRESGWSRPS